MASTENRNQTIVRQVELLIDTAKKAEHRNTEEALSVSFEAIKLAKEHNLDRQIANCYVVIGRCYWINGDFDKAIVNFNKALDLCGEFQGDYIKVEAINGLGNVYITLERFDQALTFYNQALDIAEEQKFTILISKILNNLGTLHEELRNSQIALEYYQRSYNKSLEIEDYYGMAIADLNTGNMHFSLKNIEQAKKYLNKAVEYSKENGKTLLLAHTYFTIGSMSQENNEYEKSIEEFLIAVEKALESKDSKILFRIYIQLARSYKLIKAFDKAEEVYKMGIEVANQIGMHELHSNVYEQMALFYQENGKTAKALEFYRKYYDSNIAISENQLIERKNTIDYLSKLSESLEETKVFKRLSNELNRSYNNMKILSDIGQTMTSTLEIEKIFEKLYSNINSLMVADSLSVSLYDEKEDELRFDLSIESGEYLTNHTLSLENKKSFAVWSFLNKKAIKVNDVEIEYSKYIEGIGSTRGDLMYSVMVAPLIVEGDVIGVFSIQAKERNVYTEANKILLQTLASYLAISIKNATKTKQLAKLNRILKSKSEKDGLTGISNRRLFDERYDELWNQSIKHNESITVMIIDIDNFKDFNDLYGHLIGDEVIKSVASALERTKEYNDFVARYGGDEFVAVLPNANQESISRFDRDFREKLRNVNLELDIDTQVTVSIGIASIFSNSTLDKKKLIYAADNQLYVSKEKGKNTSSIKTL